MYRILMAGCLLTLLTACENPLASFTDDFGELSYGINIEDLEGWTKASHSSSAEADYELLFDNNTNTVHRLDITISSENYELMEEDMTSLYGTFGGSRGGSTFADSDPVYVPVTVEFNGQTWWYAGMRYKGNSSLMTAWQSGNHKLPFRLDFDHFDYIWDFTDDQRFWGFEMMTFSSGMNDDTILRDMLGSELFLQGGIEAARASFCRVFVDVGDGEGAVYWGLYTMLEDPSDQMLEKQFDDGSGNLYKPDDEDHSTLSYNDFESEYYEKKTNEDSSDWSDIKAFMYELNYAEISDGTSAWADLEALFDVDHYLDYLAINNTFQNWDVYGSKAHNYYLYADPSDGNCFTWFPWDMNEAFTDNDECLSLDVNSDYSSGVYGDWPLLDNILAMSYYQTLYKNKVDAYFNTTPTYSYSDISDLITTYADLIEEYVLDEEEGYTWQDSISSSSYASAVTSLKTQISSRINAAISYVD